MGTVDETKNRKYYRVARKVALKQKRKASGQKLSDPALLGNKKPKGAYRKPPKATMKQKMESE